MLYVNGLLKLITKKIFHFLNQLLIKINNQKNLSFFQSVYTLFFLNFSRKTRNTTFSFIKFQLSIYDIVHDIKIKDRKRELNFHFLSIMKPYYINYLSQISKKSSHNIHIN